MQQISLIILVLLNISNYSLAQSNKKEYDIVCTYEINYQPDSTNVQSRMKEDMLLFLNGSGSIFMSKNLFLRDSVDAIHETSQVSTQFLKETQTSFDYDITKDVSGFMIIHDLVHHELYEYKEPKNIVTWEISPETSTFSGYTCQKALSKFGGRIWTAWFTTEIPISDGPYKFNGLPGLIVKIVDSQNYYSFILTGLINTKKTIKRTYYSLPIKVTKEKFYATLKNYKENRFAADQQSGITFTSGQEEIKKRLEEAAKKDNNPIEFINK